MPIIFRMVGATSHNLPSLIVLKLLFNIKQGTLLVVCAVFGLPSIYS